MSQYALYPSAVVACLRAAIWHEPLSVNPLLLREAGFWQAAYRQDCGHLLAVWALNQGYAVYEEERMRVWVYARMQRQVRQNHFLTDLVTLFQAHAIPTVLLKGYGLCSLYPDAAMRDYGDIDLYVGREHYKEAYSLVKTAYPNAYWMSPEGVGHHFILVLDEKRELVAEIHNLAMDFFGQPKVEKCFTDFTDSRLAHPDTLTLYDTAVCVPPLGYNAVYLFVHNWHHFEASGVGLRQLCDWVLCLNSLHHRLSESEWVLLEQQLYVLLQSMHLLTVWRTFGYVAVLYLGLSQSAFPLYAVSYRSATSPAKSYTYSAYRIWQAERLYRQLLAEGHCGRTTNKITHSAGFVHRLHAFCRLTNNALQLAKLFPAYSLRTYCAQCITLLCRKK